MAILVHYFSLAGFTWILLESVVLYLKLVLVYRGESLSIKKFLLFGWGMFMFSNNQYASKICNLSN